jgi:hypothetical protein
MQPSGDPGADEAERPALAVVATRNGMPRHVPVRGYPESLRVILAFLSVPWASDLLIVYI